MTRPKKIVVRRTLGRKIINFFIVTFAVVVTLLIFFFGFSQTSTFREYLRKTIITEVNNSVNGKFNIERINGSILSSLILKNTSLVQNQDTIFKAENISIRLRPHKLIFDIVYVSQLNIFDAEIKISQDENLIWNIDNLAKSDSVINKHEEISDSIDSSPSPLTIQVEDLNLSKLNLNYKSYQYRDSSNNYDVINWDDLNIANINLNGTVIANLKKSIYNLQLEHFSFTPNAKKFNLKHLAGNFIITPDFAQVSDFIFYTDSTEISFNARLDSLNLFGSVNLEEFNDYPMNLRLVAPRVHFDDLTYFIGATDILKGTPSLNVSARGNFGDFDIHFLELKYLDTELNLSGNVKKLHTPQHLYITADINNSTISQPDADKLLPEVGIPVMNNLLLSNFTGKFEGEPVKFNSTLNGNINNGLLNAEVNLDLKQEDMIYDIKFNTNRLNLFPVINVNTDLTSSGKIKGLGTDPRNMVANASIQALSSKILDYRIDSLQMNITGKNKQLITVLNARVEDSYFSSENILDFTDTLRVDYEFTGMFNDLNLAKVLKDSSHTSSLNLKYNLSGSDMNISNTMANLNLELENSYYQNRFLDYSEIDFIIDYNYKNNRNIELHSDILDFNLTGAFDIQELISLAAYESDVISTVMLSKLIRLNPLFVIQDSTTITTEHLAFDHITKSRQKADFNFNFKNSELTKFLLGGSRISLSASGNGYLENDTSGFSISNEIVLEQFTRVSEGNPIYLSDIYINLHLSRNNNLLTFKELFGNLSLEGKRIYTGSELTNLESEISFNANKMYFNFNTSVDTTLQIASEGLISMSDSIQIIELNDLAINYNQSRWANKDSIKLTYKPLSFVLDNFNLHTNGTSLTTSGTLYNFGEQDFNIVLTNLENENLCQFLPFLNDPKFNTIINSKIYLSGSFDDPIIITEIDADSLRYDKKTFGSLSGNFQYVNKVLTSNINVIDEKSDFENPALNIKGTIPVNLSFNPVEKRLIDDQPIDMHLKSTSFNLKTFGNVLPLIENPNGKLVADLSLTGTFADIKYSGFAEIQNSLMTMKMNNLEYELGFRINFENQRAEFVNMYIKNTDDVRNRGNLSGSGEIIFKGITPDNLSLNFTGNLSLLGQKSKLINTNYFGDLFVETQTPLSFRYTQSGSRLDGDLRLRNTDILYSLEEERIDYQSTDIVYKIKVDTSKIDQEELRFKSLLSDIDSVRITEEYDVSNFDFNLSFDIVSSARLVIVLPNLLNQKLFIEAAGGFTYSSINNMPRAQGTINLLPGSTLDFFKTFQASGSLRFESELSNPNLDIAAIYQSDYVVEDKDPEPVAVRIQIQGPLSELGKSLSSDENIYIQRGTSNIQNNVRDARYDFSDALTFLTFNKFKEDLSSQDRSRGIEGTLLTSAGMSLAGTFLSDLVNSSVGGVINNIQLSQTQRAKDSYYLYSLSGKYKDFRYSFGGTLGGPSQYFNPEQMEIKVEYLITPNFSIRGEQRRPVGTTNDLTQLIRELGIKYNIEF